MGSGSTLHERTEDLLPDLSDRWNIECSPELHFVLTWICPHSGDFQAPNATSDAEIKVD